MALSKLFNLFALSSLAIIVCLSGSTPVTALTANHNLARHAAHGHDVIAKKKKRATACKPRLPSPIPSSSIAISLSSAVPTPPPAPTSKAAPSPSHTSSALPPPPPPSSPSGSGKVGLGWALGNDPSLKNFVTDKTTMLYTWGPELPTNLYGLEGVPMLWGKNQIQTFQELVKPGYATHVLGFNEPNEPGQSNMTPQEGAELWKQYIQPLKDDGYTLISPATSSNPNGEVWMKEFLGNCTGCTLDKVAIHWYATTPQEFIDYATLWHDMFNLPIWVTEFACQNYDNGPQCTMDQVWSFASQVTSWMEETEWIEYFCPFGVMTDMQGVNTDNQLMNNAGDPTPLGELYINA